MKCDCKTDIEAKLLEQLKGQTPTGSDHAVSLSNYGFVLLENRMTIRPYTVVNTTVTMPKKAGGFTQKRNTMNMFFSFCPYCGESVLGEPDAVGTAPAETPLQAHMAKQADERAHRIATVAAMDLVLCELIHKEADTYLLPHNQADAHTLDCITHLVVAGKATSHDTDHGHIVVVLGDFPPPVLSSVRVEGGVA